MFDPVIANIHDHTSDHEGRAQNVSGAATDQSVGRLLDQAVLATDNFAQAGFANLAIFKDLPEQLTAGGPGRVVVPGQEVASGHVASEAISAIRRAGGSEAAVQLANSGAMGATVGGRSIEAPSRQPNQQAETIGIEEKLEQAGLIKIAEAEELSTDRKHDLRIGNKQSQAEVLAQAEALEVDDFEALRSKREVGITQPIAKEITDSVEQPVSDREPLRLVKAEAAARAPEREAIAIELGPDQDPGALPAFVEKYLGSARAAVDSERGNLAVAA